MAEVAEVRPSCYFCHCCKAEVTLKLPDFVCARCESDFIEEVTEDSSLLQRGEVGGDEVLVTGGMSSQFSELWQMLFLERSALLSNPAISNTESDQPLEGLRPLVSPEELMESPAVQQVSQQRQCQPHQEPVVEGTVQEFLAGLFANSNNAGSEPLAWSATLYSNPGDYAWGQGGYNAIGTQLLGQSENANPLSTEEEMISSLPTVHVSSEQIASLMECPVCREPYTPGELVRQLPCLHCFHTECIVPWLQLHDTCPVCRKNLNGDGNPLRQAAAQEPSSVTAELYKTQNF